MDILENPCTEGYDGLQKTKSMEKDLIDILRINDRAAVKKKSTKNTKKQSKHEKIPADGLNFYKVGARCGITREMSAKLGHWHDLEKIPGKPYQVVPDTHKKNIQRMIIECQFPLVAVTIRKFWCVNVPTKQNKIRAKFSKILIKNINSSGLTF